MVTFVLIIMLLFTMIGAYMFTSRTVDADYSGKISGNSSEDNRTVLGSDFLNRSKRKVAEQGPQ